MDVDPNAAAIIVDEERDACSNIAGEEGGEDGGEAAKNVAVFTDPVFCRDGPSFRGPEVGLYFAFFFIFSRCTRILFQASQDKSQFGKFVTISQSRRIMTPSSGVCIATIDEPVSLEEVADAAEIEDDAEVEEAEGAGTAEEGMNMVPVVGAVVDVVTLLDENDVDEDDVEDEEDIVMDGLQ